MTVELIILVSIVSGSGGGGLLYYLLKTFLTEKIKNQIKFEYQLKFENSLKELEKKAVEHQIKYSKFHIDRSEKLKEVYDSLVENEAALEKFVHIGQGNDWNTNVEREENARTQFQVLSDIVKKSRIYFCKELCKKIDSLVFDYKSVIAEMSAAKVNSRTFAQDEKEEIFIEIWMSQREKVANEIVMTRELIEEEFRLLLGV